MSCTGPHCTCVYCSGTSAQTPILRENLPGLTTVPYRAGTWSSFKQTMLARLSSADYPALAALRTRADDDFTIALLDATSVMLDVLTFYQERLVNESFLRTATQLSSLTQLSRLIGYQPSPGVAASTYVAFTLRGTPNQPPPPTSAPPITIPAGTRMQSVPAQGQTPQTFETSIDIPAKPDWTALPLQTSQPWLPPSVTQATGMYLAGSATQLQPGDALLFLGVERETWIASPNGTPPDTWDIVILTKVHPDPLRKLTYVAWDTPLLHENSADPATSTDTRVFAFRQRASLFGHNAPNPNLFVNPTSLSPLFPNLISNANPTWQWKALQIPSPTQIDLDAPYPRITTGSWFALLDADPSGLYAQLFRVARAHAVSASGFTLSARVTELQPDFTDPSIPPATPTAVFTPISGDLTGFNVPTTEVLAQSEALPVAPQPLPYPLYGTLLDLQDLRPDLTTLQAVALSGKRQKIAVASGITTLAFNPTDNSGLTPLHPGDYLTVTTPPAVNPDGSFPDWSADTTPIILAVQDAAARPGTVRATLSQFTLIPAAATDPTTSEFALVAAILPATDPYPHTRLQLTAPLATCYDRTATTCNANVALATHGASTTELLGSGQASTRNQTFTLKQKPLTYTPAITPTGRQSSLQIRVNGVAWSEVPTLVGQPPTARVFATLNQPDGTARILFGDGIEGALLPTGQNNIIARYRTGLGASGNLPANTLTTLLDHPLGVSAVTNPSPPTGGQNPQTIDDLRAAAPRSLLTLGRAVSLADYESFATTFAGIAKAQATWIPAGHTRGLFLTVAGVGGTPIPDTSPTLTKLIASLQNFGSPLIPITAQSFLPKRFGLTADLQYDPAYDPPTVKAQVLRTLTDTYSFDRRTFGQTVTSDEIAAVIQALPGILAVNVTSLSIGTTLLHLNAAPRRIPLNLHPLQATPALDSSRLRASTRILRRNRPDLTLRLTPRRPILRRDAPPKPAQILLLDPSPNAVVLGVMA